MDRLDVNGLSAASILHILTTQDEDSKDVSNAIMIAVLCDICTQLEQMRAEITEIRKMTDLM